VKKCARSTCSNQVPDGRQKFCSPECRNVCKGERQSHSKEARRAQRARQVPLAKLPIMEKYEGKRECYECHELFMSEGPWNRRCPKCVQKEKSAQGSHATYLSMTREKRLSSILKKREAKLNVR